jgi:hypothetical protein
MVTLRGLSGRFAAYKLVKGEGWEREKREKEERKRGEEERRGSRGVGLEGVVVVREFHDGESYGHVEGSLGWVCCI